MSPWQTPEAPSGVRWRFTGRTGGVSQGRYAELNLGQHVGDDRAAVRRNRALLAQSLEVPPDRVAANDAAHGNNTALVHEGGTVGQVDGLVTRERNLGLLALGADCATVALADPEAQVIGAVHSGWRGVAADVVGSTVRKMESEGANPDQMVAVIGPAICPGCYEVSEEVRNTVASSVAAAAAETRIGTPAVDLQTGIAAQLREVGIMRYFTDPTCTYESEKLFSYRRDGETGRHGMLIALTETSHE